MFVHKPQLTKILNVCGKVALITIEEGNVYIDSQLQIITWNDKKNLESFVPPLELMKILTTIINLSHNNNFS
jgi:hypothetical protein